VKAAPFRYHAPRTTADALDILAAGDGDTKVLAGGQSLVPILAMRLGRFDHLVDLNRVPELVGIDSVEGALRVGAMTSQATVERSVQVARDVPLLHRATPFIGHFQIRNRGTVGGSIAHADPASEYPAVAVALGARIELRGPASVRWVDAADFFVGTWTTAAEPDEIVTAVLFPVRSPRSGAAVEELARRHGDFAVAGTTCAVAVDDDGRINTAAIALFGVGSTPVRARAAEAALVGSVGGTDLRDAAQLAVADLDPPSDLHAPGSYRRKVAAVLVARALDRALTEARQETP
jgi:carbon-monoxide dehydrogenase medium subunit